MVTFMPFRWELMLTSGGPKNAIEKRKKKKGKNIHYVFSVNPISVTNIYS